MSQQTQDNQVQPLVVSMSVAAKMLSVDYLTVRNLMARGELKFVTIGSQKRINLNYLRSLAGEPSEETTQTA